VSLLAARGFGHSDEPHAPSLGSSFVTAPSLNFRRAKRRQIRVYPFLAGGTVRILCGQLLTASEQFCGFAVAR
jgi:hypothetical protein